MHSKTTLLYSGRKFSHLRKVLIIGQMFVYNITKRYTNRHSERGYLYELQTEKNGGSTEKSQKIQAGGIDT